MKIKISMLVFCFWCNVAYSQSNDSFFERIEGLIKQEKYENALSSIDSAIRVSPQIPDFYYAKSGVLQGMGKFFDALDILNTCLKNNPEAIDAHIERGNIFDLLLEFEAAIVEYQQAANKATDDKSKSFAYSNLGGTKMKIRSNSEAYDILKKAVELDKTNINALNNLAGCCNEIGKKQEALTYLESIIKIDPKYVPGYVNLGYYYLTENNHNKAVEYFNQALALDPSEAFAYNNRGYSYLQLGKLKEAMSDVEKAIKLNPVNAYAYRNRALIYLKEKNIEAMCKDITQGLLMKFTEMYGQELEEMKSKYCK